MAYIIFEFNNNRYRLERDDSEVEKMFEWVTGIKIEKKKTHEIKKHIEDIEKEPVFIEESMEMRHPTVDDLINLFRTQINFEFGTELIREKFYPNLSKEDWRKSYYSIYAKINDAMKRIEEEEKGHFTKRREGKFTYYRFIKENTPPLSKYETKTIENI